MRTVKRILVATDGSRDAAQAVEWLDEFPLPADAAVEVVNAVQVPFATEAVLALGWKDVVVGSERLVEEARGRLAKRWPNTTSRLLDGEPRQAIIDAARRSAADLIVVGARGHGALSSFLLGSVSLAVTRHARCPVLVCRGGARPLRRVTIAFDASAHAHDALEFFRRLPLSAELRVRLVAVVEPLRYPTSAPGFLSGTLRQAMHDFENETREQLQASIEPAITRLRSRIHGVVTATLSGAPAETILREAESDASDLIVVGARGLGALGRVAMGSVSESVLRHASCPVLVVRSQAA